MTTYKKMTYTNFQKKKKDDKVTYKNMSLICGLGFQRAATMMAEQRHVRNNTYTTHTKNGASPLKRQRPPLLTHPLQQGHAS